MLDWKEDWQHLQNQLMRQQIGTLGSKDMHQKKRDLRVVKETLSAQKSLENWRQIGSFSQEQSNVCSCSCKSLAINIEDTNISYLTAAKKGRKVRFTTEETIMSKYIHPSHAVLHWDAKLHVS